ncbi:unnamed protein product [Clavelina lepadiformis]|uniref:G-protein coupled receptors family 1 profile domain-containing protein n=1 Tax=Clavelina lepadiformis TaxID=159417 RepID=A0ABP0G2E2_CLALP
MFRNTVGFFILCLFSFTFANRKTLSEGFKSDFSDHEVDLPIYDGDYENFAKILDEEMKKQDVAQTSSRQVVMSAIYVAIAFFGFLLHIYALISTQKCRAVQYSQRLFMQNICIASLLLIVTLGFSSYHRAADQWPFGSVMCKIVSCLKSLSILAQSFFVTTLCTDYVVLKRKPRFAETKRTILEISVLIFGWVFSVSFASPILAFANTISFGDDENQTEENCQLVIGDDLQSTSEDVDIFIPVQKWNITENEYAYGYYDSTDIFQLDDNLGCKYYYKRSYFVWVICVFVLSYIVPLFIAFSLWIAHRIIPFIPNSIRGQHKKTITKKTAPDARHKVNFAGGLAAAGTWVWLIAFGYFLCWLPLHVYHIGRIIGLDITPNSCNDLRDYSFVQGSLSCILLPAFIISYTKPNRCRKANDGAGSSLTSSLPSGGSGSSHKLATISPSNSHQETSELLSGDIANCARKAEN